MQVKTEEDFYKFLKKEKIEYLNLLFPDVLGFLRNVEIPIEEIDDKLKNGASVDGSSIEGFARIEESDLVLKPIPATIRKYKLDSDNTGILFCTIERPDGKRFDGDSLWILEKQIEKAKEMGFDNFYTGPELEFFLLENHTREINNVLNLTEKPTDSGYYFSIGMDNDKDRPTRSSIMKHCKEMDIPVEYSHHEVAPLQHEIDLKYTDAFEMALRSMLYRLIVRDVANMNGLYATFMPKPFQNRNGNGMHVHQSLTKDGKNVFYDPRDKYKLSDIAKMYIAGILNHGCEIVAITNQWVNSYQRLVPGYEAPTVLCWGTRNRSLAVRVPQFKTPEAARIEVRFPDPACNIPLTFALMLACGLKGIEQEYELPNPVEENIYNLNEEEITKRGITSLPQNLKEATEIMKKSKLVKYVLGKHIHQSIIANRKKQWEDYIYNVTGKDIENHLVTQYELEQLLPIL